MRIVIETEDQTTAPLTMADRLQAPAEEQPQAAAQDAGPGPAAESGPAGRTAPGSTGVSTSEAVDAGAPPEWLIDEIARLRAEEEGGTTTEHNLEDAGPAGNNTATKKTNTGTAVADNARKGKKSS